jgi:hypothetical protein
MSAMGQAQHLRAIRMSASPQKATFRQSPSAVASGPRLVKATAPGDANFALMSMVECGARSLNRGDAQGDEITKKRT